MTLSEDGATTQHAYSPRESEMLANAKQMAAAKRWLADRVRRGRSGGMFAEIAELTPALAYILMKDHNAHNRPYRKARGDFFQHIIRSGQWMLTSQGISLATDGRMNNGQHRCAAVIATGQSVPVLFVFGEMLDAFAVIDTQAPRGGGDVLAISGEKHTSTLAAAARILAGIEAGKAKAVTVLTNSEMIQFVEDHPLLRECGAPAHRLCRALKRTSAGGAAVGYYCILNSRHPPHIREEFWDKVCTGVGLDNPRNPILVFRTSAQNGTLLRYRSGVGVLIAAAIVNTFNAWTQGKKATSVAWRDGTAFPEVI